MTDFKVELRHRCRNPRCRSKLPSPVANPREAFCTRGCHSGFYRTRCLVCEAAMQRRTENQLICGKRRCRNALQARLGLGKHLPSSAGVSPLETSTKPGIKSGVANDRAWRIVAGPELTPTQLHCATVGATETVEAIDRSNARHWRAAAEERRLVKRDGAPVNIVGGYKFPGAPDIDLSPIAAEPIQTSDAWSNWQPSPDDLSIPAFLRRAANKT